MIETLTSSVPEALIAVVLAIGVLSIVKFVLTSFNAVYECFLRGGKNLKKHGSWAVVTGATDGIGKAYAMQLAKSGFNVCLISRTLQKLNDVAQAISEQYPGVETKVIVQDYGKFDSASRVKMADSLKDLEIGVLVNNVGMSYPHPKYFNELTDAEVEGLLELNISSTTWMTRIVLKGMADRGKGGQIINLSSGAGLNPAPLLSQYGAAKSYIEKFSSSLDAEWKAKGIRVQCQAPYYVVSKLSKFKKPSFMIPTPEAYVKCAFKCHGHEAVAQPYWPHRFQSYVMSLLPASFVVNQINNLHKTIRGKALKKAAREAAKAKGE